MNPRSWRRESGEEGFTLIELLVVMIIIGILASIAIPVFLNQQKKANDTATKSDVAIIGKQIATFYVDSSQPSMSLVTSGAVRYVRVSDGSQPFDVFLSDGTEVDMTTYHITSAQDWCVAARNSQGTGDYFKSSANRGNEKGNCP